MLKTYVKQDPAITHTQSKIPISIIVIHQRGDVNSWRSTLFFPMVLGSWVNVFLCKDKVETIL